MKRPMPQRRKAEDRTKPLFIRLPHFDRMSAVYVVSVFVIVKNDFPDTTSFISHRLDVKNCRRRLPTEAMTIPMFVSIRTGFPPRTVSPIIFLPYLLHNSLHLSWCI